MKNIFKKNTLGQELRANVTPQERHEQASKSGWKNIGSSLAILLIAPLLAVLITIFVFQSYEVYGPSMQTTLQNGDRLIVFKLSKYWAGLVGNEYIPKRGEIVVFDKPSSLSNVSGEVKHLIKRVIGLPGERVVVKGGKITIYNKDNSAGFDPDSNQEYSKDITYTAGDVDITVGPGEVFVCGDNRNNSLDSRVFGAISTKTITGTAKLRFLPVDTMTSL